MNFNANKIKGLMAEKSLTQKQVAKVIGKSTVTFRSKLQGKTEFTVEEIIKLAKFLEVSPTVFFAPPAAKQN